MFTKKFIFTLSLVMMMALAGATSAFAADINLGYVEWDCAISQTHIAAAVLEEHYGLDVELTAVDAGFLYSGLAQGDLDAFLAAWLPGTHGHYMEEFGDRLINVGANLEGAKIGLVVPQYVDIDSIEELNDHADKFNYTITGIEPGAGIMSATDSAIVAYDLDLDVMESSSAAMAIQLGQAYNNNEWIVVTGWTPHWKFGSYDLKYLEDPLGEYGGSENVHTILRKGFFDDFDGEISEFFASFYLTQDQLHDMMNIIEEGTMGELELAKQWIQDNDDLVQSWIK